MAIALDTPRCKGYTACENGQYLTDNPYQSMNYLSEWFEWNDGWQQAYNDNRFGIKNDN